MEKGKIIFLNGVSSVGKTTLAKALQNTLTEPFYWLSGDTFVSMEPEKFLKIDEKTTAHTTYSAFYYTIKAFSDIGVNVIADHIFIKSITPLTECVVLLRDYPVMFVLITCPLEELKRREKERGDRYIGIGEWQLAEIEPKDTYDLTIDTYMEPIEICTHKV